MERSTPVVNSSVSWAIQSDVKSKNPTLLASACASMGIRTYVFEIGNEDLPDVPTDKPVLFYGSCHFVQNALRSGMWCPCAYFDEHLLRQSQYLEHYGLRMLNSDAQVMPLRDTTRLPTSGKFFVRSDKDLKELSGAVWKGEELHRFLDRVMASGDAVALDMPVVVASHKRIDLEWRVFIVDGQVSGGSQYRYMGDTVHSRALPDDVVSFALSTAAIWSPLPAFVMDIASINSRLFVLELNGFNSAGFYAANVADVVADVSRYASLVLPP